MRDDLIDVPLRVDIETAELYRWLGNDAVVIILRAHILECEAAELAGGRSDRESWRRLFEACYLLDTVDCYSLAKMSLARLAAES